MLLAPSNKNSLKTVKLGPGSVITRRVDVLISRKKGHHDFESKVRFKVKSGHVKPEKISSYPTWVLDTKVRFSTIDPRAPRLVTPGSLHLGPYKSLVFGIQIPKSIFRSGEVAEFKAVFKNPTSETLRIALWVCSIDNHMETEGSGFSLIHKSCRKNVMNGVPIKPNSKITRSFRIKIHDLVGRYEPMIHFVSKPEKHLEGVFGRSYSLKIPITVTK